MKYATLSAMVEILQGSNGAFGFRLFLGNYLISRGMCYIMCLSLTANLKINNEHSIFYDRRTVSIIISISITISNK